MNPKSSSDSSKKAESAILCKLCLKSVSDNDDEILCDLLNMGPNEM